MMHYMFKACWGLKTLDLTSFDTRNVTNMGWLFYQCSSSQIVNVTHDFVLAENATVPVTLNYVD